VIRATRYSLAFSSSIREVRRGEAKEFASPRFFVWCAESYRKKLCNVGVVEMCVGKLLVLVGAGFLMAGCSGRSLEGRSGRLLRTHSVQERVRGYWESFAAGDLRKAYGYVAAGGVSYEEFVAREKPPGAGELSSWELVSISVLESGDAEAELNLLYRMPFFEKPLEVKVAERWTFRQGTWYRILPERVVNPFTVSGH